MRLEWPVSTAPLQTQAQCTSLHPDSKRKLSLVHSQPKPRSEMACFHRGLCLQVHFLKQTLEEASQWSQRRVHWTHVKCHRRGFLPKSAHPISPISINTLNAYDLQITRNWIHTFSHNYILGVHAPDV